MSTTGFDDRFVYRAFGQRLDLDESPAVIWADETDQQHVRLTRAVPESVDVERGVNDCVREMALWCIERGWALRKIAIEVYRFDTLDQARRFFFDHTERHGDRHPLETMVMGFTSSQMWVVEISAIATRVETEFVRHGGDSPG